MSLPFALDDVREVVFYKRDELTVDLICCDVEVDGSDGPVTWSNNEEANTWTSWIEGLTALHGFDRDWYGKVSHPPFAASRTVAYERAR